MNGKSFQKNGIFIDNEKSLMNLSVIHKGFFYIGYYLTEFISSSIALRIAPAALGPSEFVSS